MSTEALINAVFVRPALWDKKHMNHHNRYTLAKLWDQVAEKFHSTSKDIRTKWKNIRNKFRLELTKHLKPRSGDGADLSAFSSWPYFESLMFLKDQFTPKEIQGNSDPSTEDPATLDPDDGLLGMDDSRCSLSRCPSADSVTSSASSVSRKRRRKNLLEEGMNDVATKLLQLEEKKLKALTEGKSNKNLAFFESLLPHIDKLPDEKKMLLMIEIQQLVYKHVYGQPAYQESSEPVPNMGLNSNTEA